MSRVVRLGQVYRCPVCRAEILVISATSQALDPHCCNVPMEDLERCAPVYRCDVCGIEVAALRGEAVDMDLICCNQPMILRECVVPEAA